MYIAIMRRVSRTGGMRGRLSALVGGGTRDASGGEERGFRYAASRLLNPLTRAVRRRIGSAARWSSAGRSPVYRDHRYAGYGVSIRRFAATQPTRWDLRGCSTRWQGQRGDAPDQRSPLVECRVEPGLSRPPVRATWGFDTPLRGYSTRRRGRCGHSTDGEGPLRLLSL